MTIWMMVSQDKYELPLYITDSASEMAKYAGVTVNSIYSAVSHFKSGRNKTAKFHKVEVDINEDDMP